MRMKNADTLRFMPIFGAEEEEKVRELLDALERPVELLVAHGPEEMPLPGARDVDFGAETQRIVEGLAALSDRVTFRVETEPEGFERYPAIAVLPEGVDVGIRYYGLPWGYELGSLILGVVEAGKRESTLRPESIERLAALDHDLSIDVFVTPT
jgi:alkyl hydroperoxide reductase subunit AhpF